MLQESLSLLLREMMASSRPLLLLSWSHGYRTRTGTGIVVSIIYRSYLYEYGASMSRIVLVWYECIINLLTKQRAEPLGLPE